MLYDIRINSQDTKHILFLHLSVIAMFFTSFHFGRIDFELKKPCRNTMCTFNMCWCSWTLNANSIICYYSLIWWLLLMYGALYFKVSQTFKTFNTHVLGVLFTFGIQYFLLSLCFIIFNDHKNVLEHLAALICCSACNVDDSCQQFVLLTACWQAVCEHLKDIWVNVLLKMLFGILFLCSLSVTRFPGYYFNEDS